MRTVLWFGLAVLFAVLCAGSALHIPQSLNEPPTPYLSPEANETARYLDAALDAGLTVLFGFGARFAWRKARPPRPKSSYTPGGTLFDD